MNVKRVGNIKSRKVYTSNTSGVRGVSYDKASGKWLAYIGFDNKDIHLGRYKNKADAIQARLEAEEAYFRPIINQVERKG